MTPILRSVAATLALSAMFLRALMPAGWMPNAAGAPGAPLVICSIDGVRHVPDRPTPAKNASDEHGFACPFAAAAHLAPPQQALAILPASLAGRVSSPVTKSTSRFSLLWSQHSPRGPPISA